MKKALIIILGIIVAFLIFVAIKAKSSNRVLTKEELGSVSDDFVRRQVKMQHDKEMKTKLKNDINIEQFKDNLDNMDDEKYNNIDKLVSSSNIDDILNMYENDKLTCEQLVTYYLKRIQKYDINKLNSIIELNPDAIKIAKEKDNQQDNKGKLFGIPVIIKANIGTGDKMHTTAGAYALKDSILDKDSFIVKRLKDEGAIILAKANLSEWANYMSANSSNGYSTLGGQTHNPYGKFDVGGSSSGSAVAEAANFAQVTLGTETSGSMIYPSSQNSVVGIKPSLGLVSRDRIIPITEAQDTAGIMARNVEDVALVLEVISGYNANDEITKQSESLDSNDYTKMLQDTSIQELKVGVIESPFARSEEKDIINRVADEFKKLGAEIQQVNFDDRYVSKINTGPVMQAGFKLDVNNYLKLANVEGIKDLKDIVDFNKEDIANRAAYGQELLEKSLLDDTTKENLDKLIQSNREQAGKAIDDLLEELDVIISLSNDISQVYAAAGYPAINVPAGYKTTGEPIGVTIVASKFEESKLIKIANVYEKNANHRKDPVLD